MIAQHTPVGWLVKENKQNSLLCMMNCSCYIFLLLFVKCRGGVLDRKEVLDRVGCMRWSED